MIDRSRTEGEEDKNERHKRRTKTKSADSSVVLHPKPKLISQPPTLTLTHLIEPYRVLHVGEPVQSQCLEMLTQSVHQPSPNGVGDGGFIASPNEQKSE